MDEHRILIVDDEDEFASLLSERLSARGLRVETADSGPAAIEKVKSGNYDVVVLDMVMPGMDGIETLQLLREHEPDLQVILLTGHATVEKGVNAMKLGAADFLEKPAELSDLLEKIREAHSRKLLLIEKQASEKIDDILKSKGW
jgi:DNA-binding NtrC family response regulator